tara:strand:+ start:5304 stop:6353 length:1050 start_codon:yes stop_codon:yes gene_type:complete
MILPLETFRGIFALIIVFHHLKIDTFIQNSRLIINGELVVDFFFVLSGFVISLNYFNKINSKKDLINFQKKRFLRLYPLHILTLLLFVLIELIKIIVNNYTNLQSTYMPFGGFNNVYSLVANVFLLHGWYGWSFNLPSWSISTEFYTYLIFGIIILFFNKKLILIKLLILFSLSIFLANNLGLKILDNFIYPTRCIYSFFLGVLTYIVFKKTEKISSSLYSLIAIILSLALIYYSDLFYMNFKFIIVPLFFSITIFFCSNLQINSLLYKILSNKFTVYLGSISYGIYMIHFGFVWFFRQFSRFILDIKTDERDFLLFNQYVGEFMTVTFVIIVIFFSHLSLKYFENRFR